jgi:hypothetical protein
VAEQDLYCKIYVNAPGTQQELMKRIADFMGGLISRRTITTALMSLDVIGNDDADQVRASVRDGFVYLPYYLEIDPLEDREINAAEYIATIQRLLDMLRSAYGRAVASCQFEGQLINPWM